MEVEEGRNYEEFVKSKREIRYEKVQVLVESERKGREPTATEEFPFDLYLKFRGMMSQSNKVVAVDAVEEGRKVIRGGINELKMLSSEGPISIEEIKYPHSAIGVVYSKVGNGYKFGTGCLISKNMVLTCAHNLIKLPSKELCDSFSFVPSYIQRKAEREGTSIGNIPKLGLKVSLIYLPKQFLDSPNHS